jgi:hypothetical protein
MSYTSLSFADLESDSSTRDFFQQTEKLYSSILKKRSCIKPLIISKKELELLENARLRKHTLSTPQPHPHTDSSSYTSSAFPTPLPSHSN